MASLPLKWHGGKHYLAPKIVELMPPHLVYCEPFCGGCSVLFARDPTRDWLITPEWRLKHGDKVPASLRGSSEIINDIDGELTTFWRVLQDDVAFARFARWMSAIPFSEQEWDEAILEMALTPIDPEIDPGNAIRRAAGFFVRYRQSRQGLGKVFATLSRTRTRRGMNEQASAWLSAVEGLPEAHERLRRVLILNRDALDVIRQQDEPTTHFYLDPTYLEGVRTATECYEHEMSAFDHACLLSLLARPERRSVIHKPPGTPTWSDEQWGRLTELYEIRLKGTFQLSGYHSYLYDEMAASQGWRCAEFDLPNNASGKKQKERETECVWTNYEPGQQRRA